MTPRRKEARELLEKVWHMRDAGLRYLKNQNIACNNTKPRYVLELLERALGITPMTLSRKIRPVFARFLIVTDKIAQNARVVPFDPPPLKHIRVRKPRYVSKPSPDPYADALRQQGF